MPKGPNGQKRPAVVIGAAIMVAKIATGEDQEVAPKQVTAGGKTARGAAGGNARGVKLAKAQRTTIAKNAANKVG